MTKKTPAAAASKNPNMVMQEMMITIDSMKNIYKRETEALLASDTKTFLDMQAEKLQTARAYQEGIENILTRGNDIKSVNPLLKKRLQDMQKEFTDLTSKNMDALQRMMRVTERLGNTIRVAARDSAKRSRAVAYGETGALKSSDKKTVSMGLSETA